MLDQHALEQAGSRSALAGERDYPTLSGIDFIVVCVDSSAPGAGA